MTSLSEPTGISERLDRIEQAVEDIPNHLGSLMEEGNYKLPGGMSPRDLVADHGELHEINKRVLNALDGPEAEYTDGTTYRLKEQGLVHQTKVNGQAIHRIEKTLGNGIKTKLPTDVRVAILGVAGVIIAAVIRVAFIT